MKYLKYLFNVQLICLVMMITDLGKIIATLMIVL